MKRLEFLIRRLTNRRREATGAFGLDRLVWLSIVGSISVASLVSGASALRVSRPWTCLAGRQVGWGYPRWRLWGSGTAGRGNRIGHGYRERERTPTPDERVEPEGAIEVVIEIPRGSRNKYEFDHERHLIRLDRRLFSATAYPADYGFIPGTLSEDGDPLDALVLVEDATFPGCYVTSRPVVVFWMVDEKGPDAKIICVPPGEQRWHDVWDVHQPPVGLLAEIRHFFDIYKDLEPGKATSIKGCEGRDAALAEVTASRDRFNDAPPSFIGGR